MSARGIALSLILAGGFVACGSAPRIATDDAGAGGEKSDGGAASIIPDGGKVGDARADAKKDSGKKDSGFDAGEEEDTDAGSPSTDSGTVWADAGGGFDAGSGFDAGTVSTGPITGGPCVSGATGQTAFRIVWVQGGSQAYSQTEVNGLPDKSRWHSAAYGYQIGFTSSYVDPFLGAGGLQLDGSDFIDIELSTAGLSVIHSATLVINGRSFNTTASGSFSWQTATGSAATAQGSVSNAAPYAWYGADITPELPAGDSGVLLRIKAGGPSGSLVVHKVELCIDAD